MTIRYSCSGASASEPILLLLLLLLHLLLLGNLELRMLLLHELILLLLPHQSSTYAFMEQKSYISKHLRYLFRR